MKELRPLSLFPSLLFFLLVAGCQTGTSYFPDGAPGKRLTSPKKIAVGSLDTKIFQMSTGGIPEPRYQKSHSVEKQAANSLIDLLSRNHKRSRINYPVKPLENILEPGLSRRFLLTLNQEILRTNIASLSINHLLPYPIGPWFQELKQKGFSHVILFYLRGAVPSSGFKAATWAEFALGLALGHITIPVTTFGLGTITILNLNTGMVTYFSTNISNPENLNLTNARELHNLMKSLLSPYLSELQNTSAGNSSVVFQSTRTK